MIGAGILSSLWMLWLWVAALAGVAVVAQEEMAAPDNNEPSSNTNTNNPLLPTDQRFYLPGASGSGPFEAVKDWIAAFQAKYPEVDLSISSVGSGAAQAALWGEVNCEKKPVEGLCSPPQEPEPAVTSTLWGMGGGTIDEEHYLEYEELGLQQLPALGGPILVTYSKDVTGDLGARTSRQLNFSFETIAGIFNNTILYWNDPSIQQDNPGLELPAERITVVVRSDKSGMSQTFTESIHHSVPTWPEEGIGKKPSWPLSNLTESSETGVCVVSSTDTTVEEEDPPRNFKADGQTGIGISLLRRPFSIGYLELGYFSTLEQFVAQTHLSSPAHPTSFVPASVETLKTTMGGLADRLEPDTLSLTLVDQDTPLGGYPISRYVYWYIKKDAREYQSCDQAWYVYKFIEWTFTDPLAEEIALGHGWVVPPDAVVAKALGKLDEMRCFAAGQEDGEAAAEPLFVADYTPSWYLEEDPEEGPPLLAILVPTLLAVVLVAAVVGYTYIEQKKQDSVWTVKRSELQFETKLRKPVVIGQGSFGVVHLAEYRGTKVAVKKVIPPEIKYRHQEEDHHKHLGSSTKASSETTFSDDAESGKMSVHNRGLRSIGIHKTILLSSFNRPSILSSRQRKKKYEQMKKDFVAEMRQLSKLRHPNITTTMGAVISRRQEPMLIMEYMENGSLYDAIRNDTISLNSHEDILTIVQDIAHGLRFLHSANLIHGDLKTKNVLLDSSFRAKLCDFGLSSKGRGDIARGTPYWMAPELLTEQTSNTVVSDIYAFGILLYEVYSRRNPYEGETYEEVLKLVCDPAVSKRPPVPTLCPPTIAELFHDCVQHNPLDRPSAKDVDLALKAEGTIQGRLFRISAINKELIEKNQQITSEQVSQLRHFSCMSHEIRTPLNCVIGISSLLEEEEHLSSNEKDLVKMIVSSGKLLKKVVDDVLDFNKFISGNAEIEIQRADLQENLTNIMNSMALSPITERKQICLRTFYDPCVPQYIETDSRRLQQIFYNILSNAVKFSPDCGNVDLRVTVKGENRDAFSQSPPVLQMSVIDYGSGIPDTDFEKIFQPFQQTESGMKSADGGTGLGLAIVKQLVELLGGSIYVDSNLGEWTKFVIEFPLTSPLDDKVLIGSKLRGRSVWLVSSSDLETQHMTKACDYFGVNYLHCGSMRELEAAIGSFKGRTSACFIQEDLYEDAVFESLSKRTKTILITFGPAGKIDKGQVHYKSLSRVFPSVLMQELRSMFDYASIASRLTSSAAEKKPEVSFEGMKVLVAEDNKVNQKVMTRLLQKVGVQDITIAENGQIASELALKEAYDIIFMDMQMPVMDGLEACKIITESDGGSKQSIVFLSAHTSDDFHDICLEHGAIDYLSKPCTIADLRKVLDRLMEERMMSA